MRKILNLQSLHEVFAALTAALTAALSAALTADFTRGVALQA
jgi:hypothetical protein